MDTAQKTIEYWARNYENTVTGLKVCNFWDVSAGVVENQRIAYPVPDPAHPDMPTIRLLSERVRPGVLRNAISIGCGTGHKELKIMQAGFVEHFTLVEIVPDLLDAAQTMYAEAGMKDRATFVLGDYRTAMTSQAFDLVYFDNALHHMYDVKSVISDMIGLINPTGFFLMDDFVGPTYHQFTEERYRYAEHVRSLLPASTFESGAILPTLSRIPTQAYLDADPSEACDSSSILPAIARWMPGAEIIPTGGLIYYLAGRELYHELTKAPDRDDAIIRLMFELDRVLVRANPELTCYALAIWQKRPGLPAPPDGDWKRLIRWPDWGIPIG